MINYYEGLPIVRETNTGICGYYSFDMNDNESNKPCPDLQLKLQSWVLTLKNLEIAVLRFGFTF